MNKHVRDVQDRVENVDKVLDSDNNHLVACTVLNTV